MSLTEASALITLTNLAYIAGLFDGEGSMTIYKGPVSPSGTAAVSPTYTLIVGISNNDNCPLLDIQGEFGGSIVKYNKCYQWRVTGNIALAFLREIVPYLRIRKERAELAINFQANRNHGSNGGKPLPSEVLDYYEHFYMELRRLNGRVKVGV